MNIAQALKQRKHSVLNRNRFVIEGRAGIKTTIDKQEYCSFVSNDYLGLSKHPGVIKAFKQGLKQYGLGSGASPLLGGYSRVHQALEEELADFLGYPKTLLFSSGYMANMAVITTLVQRNDCIFSDRLNHASLVDAIRLTQANTIRYKHLDMAELTNQLSKSTQEKKPWIITEGVYSVEGDIAPLNSLVKIANEHQATLVVDDAHGIGVLGKRGAGSLEHHGLNPSQVPIIVGNLSKAFGCFGAFVAGSETWIEALIQFARPYLYSTAFPPALAGAARVSLKILKKEHGRREHLQRLIQRFQTGIEQLGLTRLPSHTPIQLLMLNDSAAALALNRYLKSRGLLTGALRPPTVPLHTDRLRITFSANHTEIAIDYLLSVLEDAKKLGMVAAQ